LHAGEPGEHWPTRLHGVVAAQVPLAPDVLKQVLLSLVQNAREAMPDGGAVEVTQEESASGVRIAVADEGPGIPDDVLPRVFDPFFTTKGEAHGVGLGLFIAEGLVRRSGGRLLAGRRADGPGARFVIELPREPAAADAEAAGAARASESSSEEEG
jgi:two-component system C4-dicarboxylate transport sensor histidine kinase DctB